MTLSTALCYLRKDGKILLQLKNPGLFRRGKWSGPEGKILPGESPEQSAIREVFEETGLKAKNLKKHGILELYSRNREMKGAFDPRKKPDVLVHVFSTRDFSGELRHGKKGPLEWIPENKILFKKMLWEYNRLWMPLMLEGKRFKAKFWFEKGFAKLVRHEVKVIGKIEGLGK